MSFGFPFAATYAIAYGCRLIRGVDDGLAGDGLIAYGCGLIDSGSDMVDGLVKLEVELVKPEVACFLIT